MLKPFYLSLLVLINLSSFAQVEAGEIAIVGFDADSDHLAFVPLVDIPSNTNIYVSDNEWNELAIGSGGAFADFNEGIVTWSYASILTAGTAVEINSVNSSSSISSSIGTVSKSGNMNFASNNETVYVYLGTDEQTPTIFLTAFSNDNFNSSSGTLTNTGLTAGTSAIGIAGDEDVAIYTGSNSCESTVIACATMLNDPTNWTTDDGSGNQSADGIAAEWADVQLAFEGAALPVVWLYVTAKLLRPNQMVLQWATSSEINCSHYEVEHSTEDAHSFRQLATIPGAGTTHEVSSYEYVISSPAAENYFRLKQVDYDGQYEYSKWVRVINSFHTWSYFPNPVTHYLTIAGIDGTYSLTVRSLSGTIELQVENLVGNHDMDCSLLPAGYYLLEIMVHEDSQMVPFLKK